jgi:hypothetical protein
MNIIIRPRFLSKGGVYISDKDRDQPVGIIHNRGFETYNDLLKDKYRIDILGVDIL